MYEMFFLNDQIEDNFGCLIVWQHKGDQEPAGIENWFRKHWLCPSGLL